MANAAGMINILAIIDANFLAFVSGRSFKNSHNVSNLRRSFYVTNAKVTTANAYTVRGRTYVDSPGTGIPALGNYA